MNGNFSLLACVGVEHIANPSVQVYFLHPLDVKFFSPTHYSVSLYRTICLFLFVLLISELFFLSLYHHLTAGEKKPESVV